VATIEIVMGSAAPEALIGVAPEALIGDAPEALIGNAPKARKRQGWTTKRNDTCKL